MRFGIWASPLQPWEESLDLVQHCEATGWDTVYFADHFMPNGPGPDALDGDTLECWSIMSALAAQVPRIRLASLVTSVTYRHPAVLANIAAAVDRVSRGRLTLGIGAGWQENEHAAYGIELGTISERMDRFEEAVEVIISMLREPRTTFTGKYFQLTDATNQPAPIQERLPILIGGGGEKRTLRIAARRADEWNTWSTPDVLAHKVGVLRSYCDQLGRDPAEISVSTQALLYLSQDESWLATKRTLDGAQPVIVGTPQEVVETVSRFADAGADELIVPAFNLGRTSRAKDTCDLFMNEVASHFRS
jgi:F420-dependent oxidoreductase-like protein